MIVATTLAVTACGGASSADHQAPIPSACLPQHRQPLFAAGNTLASRIQAQTRNHCARYDRAPTTARPYSPARLRIMRAYIVCVDKHGYTLPTPNVSGDGPVFPVGTDRIPRYRAAARHCESLTRAELRSMYGIT